MKKIQTATKKRSRSSGKLSHKEHAQIVAVEHDFIIIAGGGLVVLLLTVFLFLFQ